MQKTFEYNGFKFIIDMLGRGHYMLSGGGMTMYISDSSIYDWCDDDSDPEKHEQAKREAYGYITRAIEAAD